MIKIYSPENEFDLVFIKSILLSENIQFYVHNDCFGSLQIGPPIELFNQKTVYVAHKDIDKAKDLISLYMESSYEDDGQAKRIEKLKFKLRVIAEFLLFKWFVPRRIINRR